MSEKNSKRERKLEKFLDSPCGTFVSALADLENILLEYSENNPNEKEIIETEQILAKSFEGFRIMSESREIMSSCNVNSIDYLFRILEDIAQDDRNVLLNAFGMYIDIINSEIEENEVKTFDRELFEYTEKIVNLYNSLVDKFNK